MMEDEWLSCGDPRQMLEFRRGKMSDRRCRLFSVACCRDYWDRLTDVRSQRAVEIAEQYADGQVSGPELNAACAKAAEVTQASQEFYGFAGVARETASVRQPMGPGEPFAGGSTHLWYVHTTYWEAASDFLWGFCDLHPRELIRKRHCDYLRDIFGNPFRPVAFDSRWRTGTAISLARQMYESRDFSAMPILADALQDAGCDNSDILNHCRDASASHVRGCWVVDLVLEKE